MMIRLPTQGDTCGLCHHVLIEVLTMLKDPDMQVSDAENKLIIEPFTENEVKEAIFQMEHNKAHGPDGFPAEFYQMFWKVIKNDMMAMFHEFHNCSLPLFSLNFGIITLLPKKREAKQIQQYRPICLVM